MGGLKEYHAVWLADHPHRTEEWLRERLREGFDIHHIDADHNNNDPANLAMIEHTDHMRLHGRTDTLGRLSHKRKPQRRKGKRALDRAKRNLAALDVLLNRSNRK